MQLVLHSETKRALANCVASNAHAFMLTGPGGSGKQSVAELLATQLLGVDKLEHQPGLRLIAPDKGSIGIDVVREVQRCFRLKTTGQQIVL